MILRALLLAALFVTGARADETGEIRIGQQYGFFYLPLIVMKERHLLEAQAARAGLPDRRVTYTRLASGAPLNDALISGTLDIAAAGTSPVITIWAKTRRNLRVHALASLGEVPFYLNSRNPRVATVRDFTASDRVALPAVSVSMQAVVLQMAAAQAFGPDQWKRLDQWTVSLAHPDALVALLSGRSEISAHFANPPFQDQELRDPAIHRVLSSYDVLGGPHSSAVTYATGKFHDANPRTIAAFLAALREADAIIAAEPRAVAEMYLRAEPSALGVDAIEALLRDPAIHFTVAPQRMLAFAAFQARIGQIAETPTDWHEMFFPDIAAENGS